MNAFMRNPINGEELLIVINGDAFGNNRLLSYNPRLKQSKYLATLDEYLPDVNAKGWIVFSTLDKEVFKIKANGDSLTQLTNFHISYDPKWDQFGTSIYYFQEPSLQSGPQLIKANQNGAALSALNADIPVTAPCRKSDRIIYQRVTNATVTLRLREMSTGGETTLITGPYNKQQKRTSFQNLTLDHDDIYFYWSNEGGIFRCKIGTTKVDTVYGNCQNTGNMRPYMSRVTREMTFARHTIRPISKFILLHEYKAYEYDFDVSMLREIKVFH